jgi:hypothetical protein
MNENKVTYEGLQGFLYEKFDYSITTPTLSRYLSGDRQMPFMFLVLACKALNIDINEIMDIEFEHYKQRVVERYSKIKEEG